MDQPVIWGEERCRGSEAHEWHHPGPCLFSTPLVLMIDPLIKILKTKHGDQVEMLFFMDDLKASSDNIETARVVHPIVKGYPNSVGMVINNKKFETPLKETLLDIPRTDETTYKYLGFEMKK